MGNCDQCSVEVPKGAVRCVRCVTSNSRAERERFVAVVATPAFGGPRLGIGETVSGLKPSGYAYRNAANTAWVPLDVSPDVSSMIASGRSGGDLSGEYPDTRGHVGAQLAETQRRANRLADECGRLRDALTKAERERDQAQAEVYRLRGRQ